MNTLGRLLSLAAIVILAPQPLRAAQQQYEWTGESWVPLARPAEGTADGELALVRQYVHDGKTSKAVKAAKKFVKRYPGHPAGEEVMMLAGQAEFDRGRYYQAYEWFEKQLANYPAGPLFDRSLKKEYEIAEAFLAGKKRIIGPLRLGARSEGLEILHRITEHAPGSDLARSALLRIGDYHFERREWNRAAEAYDEFLKLYGKSGQAAYAALRAARAALFMYKGAAFDDTPLLDAEQRFRNFLERFPDAARQEKVPQLLHNITELKAERLYAAGQFYERIGREQAARAAYERILQDYAGTSWASTAGQQLTRLGLDEQDQTTAQPQKRTGMWRWQLSPGEPDTQPFEPSTQKIPATKRR